MKNLKTKMMSLSTAVMMFVSSCSVHGATRVVDMDEANGSRSFEGYALNAGWEQSTLYWTASGGVYGRGNTESFRGDYSGNWDSSGASQTLTSTVKTKFPKGQNGIARLWIFQTGATVPTHKLQVVQGSTVLNEMTISTAQDQWKKQELSFVYPSTGAAPQVRLISVAADEPNIRIDNLEFGLNDGLFQVSQASLFGTAIQEGAGGATCLFPESTSTGTTDFISLGTGTGCNAWATTGSIGVTGTNSSSITIAQMPPGEYLFEVTGGFQTDTAARFCLFRIHDGTSALSDVLTINNSLAYETHLPKVTGSFSVPTALASKTFSIQAADDGAGVCRLYNGTAGTRVTWKVWRYSTTQDTLTQNTLDSLGSVFYVANSTCPSGSLIADGSAVSRSTYAPLFGRIGTTHGSGDGSTTFNLPDLRGIFVRGSGTQSISGQSFSGTLGTKAVDGFESHTHTQNSHNHTQDSHNHTQNAHDHTFTINGLSGQGTIYGDGAANTGDYDRYANGGAGIYGSIDLDTATATNNASTATNQAATATNQNTGGSETAPANIGLTPCISTASIAAPVMVGSVTAPDYSGPTKINTIKTVTSTSYTPTENDETIITDTATAGADITINLPTASSFKGKKFIIKHFGTSFLTRLNTTTDSVHDVLSNRFLFGQNGSTPQVTVQSDGSLWWVLSNSVAQSVMARIAGASATTVCSSNPCTVYFPNAPWISSVTYIGSGTYDININSDFRPHSSKKLSCRGHQGTGSTQARIVQDVNSSTNSVVRMYARQDFDGATMNAAFNVECLLNGLAL